MYNYSLFTNTSFYDDRNDRNECILSNHAISHLLIHKHLKFIFVYLLLFNTYSNLCDFLNDLRLHQIFRALGSD